MSTTTPTQASASQRPAVTSTGIDPRGPQFAAAITVVVLVAILALSNVAPTAATILTAIQAALFVLGAAAGVQKTPHSWLFKHLVRPRLGKPDHLEDPKPPQFAQGVGAAFTIGALGAFLAGATLLGQVLIGAALIAATLNAVFRFCLGCEVYLLIQRATH